MDIRQLRLQALRWYTPDKGAHGLAALLMAMEVPAPGVGCKCHLTNPTGDRHARRRFATNAKADAADCCRPAHGVEHSCARTHCDPPEPRGLRARLRGVLPGAGPDSADPDGPASRRRFASGLQRSDARTSRRNSERLTPRAAANARVRPAAKGESADISGHPAQRLNRNFICLGRGAPVRRGRGSVCLWLGTRTKKVRPLALGLELPKFGNGVVFRPLADSGSGNAEEPSHVGIGRVGPQEIAHAALRECGRHGGAHLKRS